MSKKSKEARKSPVPLPEPLPDVFDTHTHVTSCGATDEQGVIALADRAQSVGVNRLVTVADDMQGARDAVSAATWDDRVFAAVAIHPTHAGQLAGVSEELEQLARHERVVAIGETGLDWYWIGKMDDVADASTQRRAFAWHIDLAKRLDKPLMIHNRDADADIIEVLDAEGAPNKVIFHCFSGDADMARLCVDRGFYLSFSGTVTFKNNTLLQDAMRLVPDDQIFFETDAPYLTPHPYRGRPNESYCTVYTVRAAAEMRGQDPVALGACAAENARRVFRVR